MTQRNRPQTMDLHVDSSGALVAGTIGTYGSPGASRLYAFAGSRTGSLAPASAESSEGSGVGWDTDTVLRRRAGAECSSATRTRADSGGQAATERRLAAPEDRQRL